MYIKAIREWWIFPVRQTLWNMHRVRHLESVCIIAFHSRCIGWPKRRRLHECCINNRYVATILLKIYIYFEIDELYVVISTASDLMKKAIFLPKQLTKIVEFERIQMWYQEYCLENRMTSQQRNSSNEILCDFRVFHRRPELFENMKKCTFQFSALKNWQSLNSIRHWYKREHFTDWRASVW